MRLLHARIAAVSHHRREAWDPAGKITVTEYLFAVSQCLKNKEQTPFTMAKSIEPVTCEHARTLCATAADLDSAD